MKISWTRGTMQRSRQLWVSKVACLSLEQGGMPLSCLSRWQLWKISPLSTHTHSRTHCYLAHCTLHTTHTLTYVVHSSIGQMHTAHHCWYALTWSGKRRKHKCAKFFDQNAILCYTCNICKYECFLCCCMCTGGTHDSRLPSMFTQPPCAHPLTKDKITEYQSCVCLSLFSMGEQYNLIGYHSAWNQFFDK